ncbi:3'-5' exoribonuclease YhaM family protein [Aerococcus sp. 1KP-2016]|uniref:3'-5' exoribonuclease YhaM family protein n=1 Tax=Aerococcus sp. 1KP-2016 TaxID=1981982 RepID=UPI000B98FCF3|nr:HD domain-containing protein [Aerococcus sp. 1KP-2016]OYQ66401.1 3'-5' exonuclease [Aerococcus sp. 1KP-2016]
MDNLKIFDVPLDQNFDLYLLIKVAEIREDRNAKKYISFTFQDKSGSIDGKYWSATEEDIAKYTSGNVVRLAGKRELYNGNPQVRITGIRLATDEEPNNPSDYVEQGPMTDEEMKAEIKAALDGFQNPVIDTIVRKILNTVYKDFFVYPAAKKNHHAFVGGLGFHTVSMLRLAQAIANQYTNINKDLLYAGVILHDIGKTVEFTDPMSTEYSTEGNLIGHISIIDEMITLAVDQLGLDQHQEEVVLLKHMVLAHHGKQEWGSPVNPHVLEAEVLHHIDNLDASIQMMTTALDHTEPGEFSARIFGLDNRNFYKPKFDAEIEVTNEMPEV